MKYETFRCGNTDRDIRKIKIIFDSSKIKYYRFKNFNEKYFNGLILKIKGMKKYLVYHPNLLGYKKKEINLGQYDENNFNLEDCKTYIADISQVEKVYDTTKELEKILKILKINKKKTKIVDFGCGFGSAIQYLSSKYSDIQFYGYDKNKKIMDMAKAFTNKDNLNFVRANFLLDRNIKLLKDVSCVINIHTLCCFKNPEKFIKSIVRFKPKFVIIKSLFYNGPLNTFIHTTDLNEAKKENIDGDLNIFSKKFILDLFKKDNYNLKLYKPFNMKKELKKKKYAGRSSYTIKFNNKLNTFTGPVYLPWGFMVLKRG